MDGDSSSPIHSVDFDLLSSCSSVPQVDFDELPSNSSCIMSVDFDSVLSPPRNPSSSQQGNAVDLYILSPPRFPSPILSPPRYPEYYYSPERFPPPVSESTPKCLKRHSKRRFFVCEDDHCKLGLGA